MSIAERQPSIIMYANQTCPYCAAARMLLKKKGLTYNEIPVSHDDDKRREMERLSGRRTVPQIFVDDQPIGGFDELYALNQDGRLDELISKSADAE